MTNFFYKLILAFVAIILFSIIILAIVAAIDFNFASDNCNWLILSAFGVLAAATIAFGLTKELIDEINKNK